MLIVRTHLNKHKIKKHHIYPLLSPSLLTKFFSFEFRHKEKVFSSFNSLVVFSPNVSIFNLFLSHFNISEKHFFPKQLYLIHIKFS